MTRSRCAGWGRSCPTAPAASCSRSGSRTARSSATCCSTAASVADEYASLPEYHGSLPPGDVIALGANPTVVARLTGADPERVRAVARTAKSAEDLPPAKELYAQLADLLGVGSEAE